MITAPKIRLSLHPKRKKKGRRLHILQDAEICDGILYDLHKEDEELLTLGGTLVDRTLQNKELWRHSNLFCSDKTFERIVYYTNLHADNSISEEWYRERRTSVDHVETKVLFTSMSFQPSWFVAILTAS